ncbi:hypothetical protein ACFL59_04800 [Planctomycetota bacterium]
MSGIGPIGHGPVGYVPEPESLDPAATPPEAQPEAAPSAPATEPAPRGVFGTLADVWASLATRVRSRFAEPTRPAEPHRNLDATGARRPVALGTNGRFTATPGTDAETPAARGEGLFTAASLIDDAKENAIDAMGLDSGARTKLLDTLREDLGAVRAGAAAPEGLSELQALQMRSSGTTVLLELMTAKETDTATKTAAFDLYRGMLDEETNPILKDGMALHLHRLRDTLPADLRGRIDEARDIVAPQRPPYEDWFADGNSTLKVDWSAGTESYKDDIHKLKEEGFEVVSEDRGGTVLQKTFEKDGKETTFEVHMRRFHSDMYKHLNDEDTHLSIYTGHANWGRNMRSSLGSMEADERGGAGKLVLNDLCVGKGEIQMFRDKFPNAHLVTTYNSSYFRPGEDGMEPDSEGFNAIMRTFDGIVGRDGYEEMAEDVRKTNPWRWSHEREGIDNNFIFPTDLATRREVLDRDHDGQADVFDRLVSFDTFKVAEDTAREFQPLTPARSADVLAGTKVHFGAMNINRLCLYSGIFEDRNSTAEVVPGGYFEPGPDESGLFRFEKVDVGGMDRVIMRMSSHSAHMSEDAVRMAACFEYNRFMAESESSWGMDEQETQLSGLVLASHSLHTDTGYRDREIWQEFLKAYNLPEVPRGEIERAKEIDHHSYSGSHASIKELQRTLDRSVLDGLTAPGAGRISG